MKSYVRLAAKLLRKMQQSVSLSDLFRRLANGESVHLFSHDQLIDFLSDSTCNNHTQLSQEISTYRQYLGDNELDFFDVLNDFSETMIVYKDGTYQFQYQFTDIWRDYNRFTDEDIVVANAVYFDDMRRCHNRKKFDWSFCIEHNNHELHTILRRGMSENHFHLRGSSPFFYISWIYLMNHVCNEEFYKRLSEIEANKLNKTIGTIRDGTLIQYWLKAAAIRIYLYSVINQIPLISDFIFIPKDVLICDIGKDKYDGLNRCHLEWYKKIESSHNVSTSFAYKVYLEFCHEQLFIRRGHECFYKLLLEFLCDDASSYLNAVRIQELIQNLTVLCEEIFTLDYANKQSIFQKYKSFAGERALEYHTLKYIHEYRANHEVVRALFYTYLSLKNRFHMELVQTNHRNGFYNFLEYQNRKDDFIPWSYETERMIAADTISSVLENEGIQSVELRISPPSSLAEGIKTLNNYLQAINDARYYARSESVFFFNFHFIKMPYTKNEVEEIQYRHFSYRQRILHQAQVIFALRRNEVNLASYIVGIDASGDEMDCRPEYFGCIFRMLQHYEPKGNPSHAQQIRATYHVGEDNYDVLDGLRAIDEAVLFLDLRSGSRIGHATALGIPVFDYYKNEFNNELSVPKVVFLDNIVWLREYIRKLQIPVKHYSEVMQFIGDEFQNLFLDIYGSSLYFVFEDSMMNIDSHLLQSYYHAWLLRSDDPELYRDYEHIKVLIPSEEYKICKSIPEIKIARNSETARKLCHLYHFNYDVKKNGFSSYKISLPQFFIEAIHEVQKFMRIKITQQGIAIETNPSSNIFIAPIEDYNEHPISVFYDNWLNSECAEVQMNVSVNTDDKSIFSTCLSNEYAYLAFALENYRDSNGVYQYKHFDVFNWLDELRKMGNEQSFMIHE